MSAFGGSGPDVALVSISLLLLLVRHLFLLAYCSAFGGFEALMFSSGKSVCLMKAICSKFSRFTMDDARPMKGKNKRKTVKIST